MQYVSMAIMRPANVVVLCLQCHQGLGLLLLGLLQRCRLAQVCFKYISYTFFSDRLLYVTDVARPFSSLDDATTVLITRCMMVWGMH